jgi:hypothetical protein
MEEKHQAAAAVQVLVHRDHQQKLQKLQQFCEMTTQFVKNQKLMRFSTQATDQHSLSVPTNTTNSQKTRLPTDIQNQSQKDGQDFQTALMLLSLTKTEKLISSKDRNTGDTTDATLMEITQKISMKALPAYPTILTLLWFGVEMERFTSIKEVNSGDSIHSRDHQSSQHIQNQLLTGREFPMTLMLPFNTLTDTLISSKAINTTDSTTELLR